MKVPICLMKLPNSLMQVPLCLMKVPNSLMKVPIGLMKVPRVDEAQSERSVWPLPFLYGRFLYMAAGAKCVAASLTRREFAECQAECARRREVVLVQLVQHRIMRDDHDGLSS